MATSVQPQGPQFSHFHNTLLARKLGDWARQERWRVGNLAQSVAVDGGGNVSRFMPGNILLLSLTERA